MARIFFYNCATIAQIILKFLFWNCLQNKLRASAEKKSACFVVLPQFCLKMVLARAISSPWPLPVTLSCFPLFSDLITMLRADGFVSTELKVVANKNKPGASEDISLEGAQVFIFFKLFSKLFL